MRTRTWLFLLLMTSATSLQAVDRYVLVSGTVGNFRTDARVLNASLAKDITVSATFLPVGNVDNTLQTPVTFTVGRRNMKILDDVVQGLFSRTEVGAIKLTSDDEFEVTTRIYAKTPGGTLGQFGPGLALTAAKSRGVLLQLKSTSSGFRTNIGAVNPNPTAVDVTWSLYDRNNVLMSSKTISMPAQSVIGPTNMANGFFFDAGAADVTDAWVTFSTDAKTPVFAYASVIDDTSTDQTFIPAVDDAGTAGQKIVDVTLQDFAITFSTPLSDLAVGDKVVLRIRNRGGHHGFTLLDPSGAVLIGGLGILPENQTIERSFTVTVAGSYRFMCNNVCGSGHGTMRGTFTPHQ